jgi:hypothetical protein
MISGRLNQPPHTMRMINRKILTGLALLLMLMVYATTMSERNNSYCVNVFESEGGWGYDILYKNKTIIHQPFIPAVSGQHPFKNKALAKETGRLVVKKIKNKKSPYLSAEEVLAITEARQ